MLLFLLLLLIDVAVAVDCCCVGVVVAVGFDVHASDDVAVTANVAVAVVAAVAAVAAVAVVALAAVVNVVAADLFPQLHIHLHGIAIELFRFVQPFIAFVAVVAFSTNLVHFTTWFIVSLSLLFTAICWFIVKRVAVMSQMSGDCRTVCLTSYVITATTIATKKQQQQT